MRMAFLAPASIGIAIGVVVALHMAKYQHEAEHRFIYGFGIRTAPRAFAGYLSPITSEGLREVRWDHQHHDTHHYSRGNIRFNVVNIYHHLACGGVPNVPNPYDDAKFLTEAE